MIDRLEVQMRAMQMLMQVQDVTANNLANINTPGFKGSKVFYRMVQEQVNGKAVSRPVPSQQVDMTQGVLEPTDNMFDFGIKGEGFFMVEGRNGNQLTRDGRMHISTDGYLVDSEGSRVIGESGPIHIPQYLKAAENTGNEVKVEVARDGTIRLNDEVLDKFRIVRVEDTSKLERMGSNYFSGKEDLLIEDQSSTVMQGYYEAGNVDPLNEMVDMMQTTKLFEMQQRAIRTTDEMLGQATSKLGKL